jgi:hypothetical protein
VAQPTKIDFAVGIGGENGQGIASTGDILARIFARRGLHLNAYNAYQSIIRGGHTFLTIRASDTPVRNMGDKTFPDGAHGAGDPAGGSARLVPKRMVAMSGDLALLPQARFSLGEVV